MGNQTRVDHGWRFVVFPKVRVGDSWLHCTNVPDKSYFLTALETTIDY